VVLSNQVETNSVGGKSRRYSLALRYRYTVGTMTYESSRLGWDADATDLPREAAERFVRDHPAGRAITVHYDPADPSIAMIDPTGAQFAPADATNVVRATIWTFAACGALALAYCAVA
jgi:hypothetical protein